MMEFGFCLMSDITEIGFFSHVEALGYASVWVTDSQMLFSDCYAVLALAAQQTRRIQLGSGVAFAARASRPCMWRPWPRSIDWLRVACTSAWAPVTPLPAAWVGRPCASPSMRSTCA